MNDFNSNNAKTIKILGILSFFIPFLSIIVLMMTNGLNKKNNYGGSFDIKIGKTCAKIKLTITIIGLILWIGCIVLMMLPTLLVGGAS